MLKVRYRLSTFLAAFTAISIIFGAIAWQRRWVVQSQLAVQKIDSFGASYSLYGVPCYALGIYLGERADLYNLWSENQPVTDQDFACMAWFTMLEEAHLGGLNITDRALPHLVGNKNLRFLDLGGNKISGRGLQSLNRFGELDSLKLSDTNITDNDLKFISKIPKLSSLGLANTQITDEGLKQIGLLSNLKGLDLSGTKITEVGLVHLLQLPKLDVVLFENTQITTQREIQFWNDRAKTTKQTSQPQNTGKMKN